MVKRKRMRAVRGMTLVELMVVIAILGMLFAAVGISVIEAKKDADRDVAQQSLARIDQALTLYFARFGKFPSTEEGLEALVKTKLISELPSDPWQHPLLYLLEDGEPVVRSLGSDGAEGGTGYDADLTSRRR